MTSMKGLNLVHIIQKSQTSLYVKSCYETLPFFCSVFMLLVSSRLRPLVSCCWPTYLKISNLAKKQCVYAKIISLQELDTTTQKVTITSNAPLKWSHIKQDSQCQAWSDSLGKGGGLLIHLGWLVFLGLADWWEVCFHCRPADSQF